MNVSREWLSMIRFTNPRNTDGISLRRANKAWTCSLGDLSCLIFRYFSDFKYPLLIKNRNPRVETVRLSTLIFQPVSWSCSQ